MLKSIFVKCLIVLAVSTAIVAGTLSKLSDRTAMSVADDGIRILALDITTLTASSLQGAVRFGKTEDAQAIITALADGEDGRIAQAVLFRADGTVFAGSTDAPDSDLTELAATAIRAGEMQMSDDGFRVVVPVGKAADGSALAALGVIWSPEFFHQRIAEERDRQLLYTAAIFLATLVLSGLFLRQTISLPLQGLASRTVTMADADYDTPVPGKARRDEIGEAARSLDALRTRLAAAVASGRDAMFQSAGLQASSAAVAMTDTDLRITHHNAAFSGLVAARIEEFRRVLPAIDASALTGIAADSLLPDPQPLRAGLSGADFPLSLDLRLGRRAIALDVNEVTGADGTALGYILEWDDVTDAQTDRAVLDALEAQQVRMDFDADGRLTAANDRIERVLPDIRGGIGTVSYRDLVRVSGGETELAALQAGRAVFATFDIRLSGQSRLVAGSLAPTLDRSGRPTGYVLLGQDVTETEAARLAAEKDAIARDTAQRQVVEGLSRALTALAEGDLTTRIEAAFASEYEELRRHFNQSMETLDRAVGTVVVNSASILGETENITSAADNLSRRTEQQAATLEEFAAALTELTASVASAADGASKASGVVTDARQNAEASGGVVREAVQAMSEIATSSEQISRIIGVIDDIAFQTNLLALNAGVEAARAGDAGRGFAVVASEVRALAQRSSDAAREINTLISTSESHVKRGVGLVDKAGAALTQIVASVGGIESHVTAIAASAREQATGLDEINSAITQLDQMTQQNVAMFEETSAATQTLSVEANALATASGRFRVNGHSSARTAGAFSSARGSAAAPLPSATDPAPASRGAAIEGSLALAEEHEDWEDF